MYKPLKMVLIILGTLFVGIVGFVVLIVAVYSPLDIQPSSEPELKQLSKPVYNKASHEGTQNQAILTLRTDHTFDLNWSAAFGFDRWWQGTWIQQGDTIRLKYKGEVNERLGANLLIDHRRLTPLDSVNWKLSLPLVVIRD